MSPVLTALLLRMQSRVPAGRGGPATREGQPLMTPLCFRGLASESIPPRVLRQSNDLLDSTGNLQERFLFYCILQTEEAIPKDEQFAQNRQQINCGTGRRGEAV